MRQHWNWRRRLNVFNSLLSQPVQSFDQQQCCDHRQERNREILTKDGDGKENLHNLSPRLLIKALHLSFPKGAKEDKFRELPKDAHNNETHIEKQNETNFGSGQIDHGRVKLAATAETMI